MLRVISKNSHPSDKETPCPNIIHKWQRDQKYFCGIMHCGFELYTEWNYCPNCGQRIEWRIS